jgi:hypothetical protein
MKAGCKGILSLFFVMFLVVAAIGRPNAVYFSQVTTPQIVKMAVKPVVRHRKHKNYSYLPKKQLKKLEKTALAISVFELLMIQK